MIKKQFLLSTLCLFFLSTLYSRDILQELYRNNQHAIDKALSTHDLATVKRTYQEAINSLHEHLPTMGANIIYYYLELLDFLSEDKSTKADFKNTEQDARRFINSFVRDHGSKVASFNDAVQTFRDHLQLFSRRFVGPTPAREELKTLVPQAPTRKDMRSKMQIIKPNTLNQES